MRGRMMVRGRHLRWNRLIGVAAMLCMALSSAAFADTCAWFELIDSSGPSMGVRMSQRGSSATSRVISQDDKSRTTSIDNRWSQEPGRADCNENGIPDDEEILADPSLDCNGNGILDECDIGDGTSEDCQPDGIPDECQLGGAENPILSEDFDDIGTLITDDWALINNSDPIALVFWFQGNDAAFPAHIGDPTAYIGVNWQSTSGGAGAIINNWLITPELVLEDGMSLTFYTRTVEDSEWPDRLEVRMSSAGSSIDVGASATSVGDFTTLLLEINPSQTVGGYPEAWTLFQVVLDSVGSPGNGRLAFRYFVTDAGDGNPNANYIGVDTVRLGMLLDYDCTDNGIPDECEPDCNNNSAADSCDIADGTSADVNGNGVPDECESDCNDNGLPDDHDIAAGTSEDCNNNKVPDECDLADGVSLDCNGNGIPDECDLAEGAGQDCNGNSVPDECDIADGTSLDCNENGIPDECESDCNGNDVPDECDLADGTSLDCNGNGIPDECDLAEGAGEDCNSNGVPDECDIADGTSQDCNGNAVPDECDLSNGNSQDCNVNLIPDECDIATGGSVDADGNGVPDGCEASPGDEPNPEASLGDEPNPTEDTVIDRNDVRGFLSFFFNVPVDGRPTLAMVPLGLFGVFGIQMSVSLFFLELLNLPVRLFLFEIMYAFLDAILP